MVIVELWSYLDLCAVVDIIYANLFTDPEGKQHGLAWVGRDNSA